MPEVAERDTVFAAFGEFMAAFSLADGSFHRFLRLITGMPDDIARLAFEGERTADIIKRVKSIAKITITHDVLMTVLGDTIEQFEKIARMRNMILHRQTFVEGGALVSSDELTSKVAREDESEYLRHQTKDLLNAASDLWKIVTQIQFVKLSLESDGKANRLLILPRHSSSWLYTPPSQ
ncbi:MAG: hypothetical protein Q8922_10110 [Bacteroidota bacterium]|nr:hypothetical protein [Bacteroidota bacterium]MDP4232408.1 hypothetical protein [Bacteroidota bacterium]MDP4241544.1 hypothetical protein [Bacteroidota bacterium]MDP4288278.1 hypothetical protein [Bacteroidota bacterium]